MKTITTEELNAIKFYLGDSKTVEDKIYLGGEKAYVTINALLNLGTRKIRKRKKGKRKIRTRKERKDYEKDKSLYA